MKLLIKNLGPIKNNTQEIDLSKRFYVFVGVNNSGKTYVSQLLWTIFNQKIIEQFSWQLKEEEIRVEISQEFEISENIVSEILKKFSEFLKSKLIEIYNVSQNSSFSNSIDISFDFSIDELKKRGIKNNINLTTKENEQGLEYLVVEKAVNSLSLKIEERKLPKSLFELLPEQEWKRKKEEYQDSAKRVFVLSIVRSLLNHHHHTFFLPSSRLFYPTFYRYIYDIERTKREEVVRKMVDLLEDNKGNITEEGIESLRNTRLYKRQYTEPMNRVFETIYSLNLDPEEVFYYSGLIENLVEVMGGDILMKSLEGIGPIEFFFKPYKQEIDLPMYLASSSVNQLSLLYLYLKYWVEEKYNFLMMDEPEENLHPANQVLLLELLLDFANQNNNRVLITTHSPLLANALNNYVYLDILKNDLDCDPDDIIEKHDLKYFNSSTSIASKGVGVYFFTGDRIIEYNSDYYGIYFGDFQEVTSAIKRSAETLTDYIYIKEREKLEQEDEDE